MCPGPTNWLGPNREIYFFEIKDSSLDWLKCYSNFIVLLFQNEENSVRGNEENLFRE